MRRSAFGELLQRAGPRDRQASRKPCSNEAGDMMSIAETIIEPAMNLNPTNDVRAFQLEIFDDILFDHSKPIPRESSYDATLSRARKLR
jgi:hypothetical protein